MSNIHAVSRALAPLTRMAMLTFAGLSMLGAAGCGSSDAPTGPAAGKITGTYTLEYVDDDELPVAVHHGPYLDPATGVFYNNYVMEVTNGYIELREDETFYIALQMRITADGQPAQGTFDFEGVWDEVKDQVILRIQWPVVGTEVLERDGNWLTMEADFMGFGETIELDFDLWKR